MNKKLMMSCLSLLVLVSTGQVLAQNKNTDYRLMLDAVKAGHLPSGWQVGATNPRGPLAVWAVAADTAAGSHENILSIERIQDTSTSVFNLNWTRQVVFLNGDINVRMRANSGKEDQGGGVIWRVQDENNYYVARYNPLESNFRLYYVEDGRRNMLASAEQLTSKPGAWVSLKIRHQGQQIQGWFNNTLAWESRDTHLPKAGGIGLWSKADAASSFADLVVRRMTTNAAGKLENE